MGSHSKNQKPDKNRSDPLPVLITRKRLREIANRRRQESNNNSKEHPLLDLEIVHHTRGCLNAATRGKPLLYPNCRNTTNNERKRIVSETVTLDSSSDENPETDEELSDAYSNPYDCQDPSCTEPGIPTVQRGKRTIAANQMVTTLKPSQDTSTATMNEKQPLSAIMDPTLPTAPTTLTQIHQ